MAAIGPARAEPPCSVDDALVRAALKELDKCDSGKLSEAAHRLLSVTAGDAMLDAAIDCLTQHRVEAVVTSTAGSAGGLWRVTSELTQAAAEEAGVDLALTGLSPISSGGGGGASGGGALAYTVNTAGAGYCSCPSFAAHVMAPALGISISSSGSSSGSTSGSGGSSSVVLPQVPVDTPPQQQQQQSAHASPFCKHLLAAYIAAALSGDTGGGDSGKEQGKGPQLHGTKTVSALAWAHASASSTS